MRTYFYNSTAMHSLHPHSLPHSFIIGIEAMVLISVYLADITCVLQGLEKGTFYTLVVFLIAFLGQTAIVNRS